ncbi:hypothetical protein LXL04_006522 [Taraxacum kok-saghyz]
MASTRDSSYSRDLLQRFTCGGGGNRNPVKPKEEAHGPPGNVELSLGLSLNGNFGVEPERTAVNDGNIDRKLFRASSVNDFVKFSVDVELSLYSPLTRTCSLPVETEAEWRKKKELQSLRRSEAKRKRVEKLKNVRVVKTKTVEDWDRNRSNSVKDGQLSEVGLKQSPPSSSTPSSPSPALQFTSQGSIGSQGSGGSSGVSDLDSQPFQGTNTKSQSQGRSESNKVDRTPKSNPRDGAWPDVQSMPCVSTKVEGSDGKKIQGFLYRYGKGEEVRIVCVCHGSFLTPSEFVKHGGGDDVEHPLKHIVVTPSLFS